MAITAEPLQRHQNTAIQEPLQEKYTHLRLEPTESMLDLTRAEYVSKQLEFAGEKNSENLLTSIVLEGLPSMTISKLCTIFRKIRWFLLK